MVSLRYLPFLFVFSLLSDVAERYPCGNWTPSQFEGRTEVQQYGLPSADLVCLRTLQLNKDQGRSTSE